MHWDPPMSSENDARFRRTAGCEVSHMPDGYVIYQAEAEKVHYLNPTAAIVYELCETSQSAAAIAAFLQANFSLDEPPLAEVRACIENLVGEGLIEPC